MPPFLYVAAIANNGSLILHFYPSRTGVDINKIDLVFHYKRKVKTENEGTVAKICLTDLGLCHTVPSRRRHDIISGHRWDVYDVSFLSMAMQIHGATESSFNIVVTFEQTKPRLYNLNNRNAPLLTFSNLPEETDVSDLFGRIDKHVRAKRFAEVHYTSAKEVYDSDHLCHLESWTVTFRALGWEGWVMQPLSYQANYCTGQCPEPIPEILNATNHAYIKSLYRSRHNNISHPVPAACCVPLRLSRISLLYTIDNMPYVRRLSEMQANHCGCI